MALTTDEVRDFFDKPLYLDRGRFLIEVRAIIVRELVGPTAGRSILDLGCGDGSLSVPLLSEATQLTLVDLSARMLEIAARRVPDAKRASVRTANVPLADFDPATPFDVVLCVGVLAHVPNIDAALLKIAACTRSGGIAVVEFTPNPNPLARLFTPYYWIRRKIRKDPMPYKTNRIPLGELLAAAERAGLELCTMKRHFFPIPTMAWWSQRWLYRYARLAMRSPLISRIGTEHIMVFTKVDRSRSV
jgi:SAM-dependent methyltransferase